MSSVPLLAIDTATSVAVVALGDADGRLIAEEPWVAGYRHGEELLPRIQRLLDGAGVPLESLRGVVVGTGPGAFTGLRVGIATAKGLAHALRQPIVGISTGEALIAADRSDDGRDERAIMLLLPAGPSDRVLVRAGHPPALLPGGTDPELGEGESLVAVDLRERAPAAAVERGERARASLGRALLELGGARFRDRDVDDLARLVPEYVTLPRGVRASSGEVAWSRDRR